MFKTTNKAIGVIAKSGGKVKTTNRQVKNLAKSADRQMTKRAKIQADVKGKTARHYATVAGSTATALGAQQAEVQKKKYDSLAQANSGLSSLLKDMYGSSQSGASQSGSTTEVGGGSVNVIEP